VGARFFAPVQTGPGAHLASCTMSTGSFLGVKSGRSVMLTPHPILVPWSRKSRATPLLPLWAVQPVQSLSCLYKCALYFYLIYVKAGSNGDSREYGDELSFPKKILNCFPTNNHQYLKENHTKFYSQHEVLISILIFFVSE
jgi:hypothetical protein